VIGATRLSSCKSNYHTVTATAVPSLLSIVESGVKHQQTSTHTSIYGTRHEFITPKANEEIVIK
jgi:hypothetical protein